MWQYIGNGQWKNGDTVTTTPPPLNQPFWYQAPDGNWVMPTYQGPESLTSLPASVDTPNVPRSNTNPPVRQPDPNRPFRVIAPNTSGGGGAITPPASPPPSPPAVHPWGRDRTPNIPNVSPGTPAPPAPPTGFQPLLRMPTVPGSRPGNIPNSIFWDPEAEAPPGFAEDKWATRFIVNGAQNAKANGPLATVPGVQRDVDPFGFESNPGIRMPVQDSINPAQFDPGLVASIREIADNGFAGVEGAGSDRARFILDHLSAPGFGLGNPARRPVSMTPAPTNPIDLLGEAFDRGRSEAAREAEIAARRADPNSPANRIPSRERDRNGNVPPAPLPPPVAEEVVGPTPVEPLADAPRYNRAATAGMSRSERQNLARARIGLPPLASRFAAGTVNPMFAQRQADSGPLNSPYINPASTRPASPWVSMPAPVVTTPAPFMVPTTDPGGRPAPMPMPQRGTWNSYIPTQGPVRGVPVLSPPPNPWMRPSPAVDYRPPSPWQRMPQTWGGVGTPSAPFR